MKRKTLLFPLVLGVGFVVFVVALGIGNIGIDERRVTEQKEFMQKMARSAKANLVYFEDERTGLCYAYIWGGDSHGGPALTLVPREKVEHLLIK